MDEVRRWWRELRDDWPDIWDICRRRGLIKALPDLAQAVFWTTLMVILFVGIIACDLIRSAWSRAYPLSQHNREKNERRRKQNALQRLLERPMRDPISAFETVHLQNHHQANNTKMSIFSRLPPEIRRQILIAAFGERTLHMDLQFRFPFNLVDQKPSEGWNVHARIHSESLAADSHLDARSGKSRAWRWFGCVCHRFDTDKTPALAFGRRCNYRWAHFGEPDTDHCLHGAGKCSSWPGKWPVKCQIGIMGWMLSCKRAYFECIDVLYNTNTIHIASPVLMKNMPELFPSQILAGIRSLELVWQPKDLPLADGFRFSQTNSKSQLPIFPSLMYLRIAFKRLVIHEVDHATNMVWPYDSKRLLSERLHNYFLPQMDDLVNRIAPGTADVTVSCAKWDWYELIDLHLLEKQGKEATKMQRAEVEGLKCWRVIPIRRSIVPNDAEAGLPFPESREGYWIHIPIGDVRFDNWYGYDWQRNELYGLGPDRFTWS